MQDIDRDFDLLVKSVLENAEEEVPSRVWSAVSSRLDSAGKKAAVIWWRRVATGLAAAAAVALVAVLGITLKSNPEEEVAEDAVALTQPMPLTNSENVFSTKPTAIVENNNADTEASVAGAAEPQIGIRQASDEVAATHDIPEGTGDLIADVIPAQNEEEDAVMALLAETKLSDEQIEADSEGNACPEITKWTDPFALMEYSQTKKKDRRIALTIGGNISTNGNASALNGNRMMMASGNYASSDYETVTRVSNNATYSVPLSFGVGVRKYVTDRFSIGLGLNYYLLGSTFTGTYIKVQSGTELYNFTSDIHSTLQYLGIPLSFYFDFVQSSRANVYFYAGATAEKGIKNRYRIEYSGGDIIYKESVDGMQYSLFGGVGVEFKLNDLLGVYVDPSLHWYPDCDQPFSIRTQQQLMFDLSLGFRFDF